MIIIVLPILLVCILAMTVVSTNSYKKSQIQLTNQVLHQMSESQALQLWGIIDDKETMLKLFAGFEEFEDMDRSVYGPFIVEELSDIGFDEVFVVDMDGIGYFPQTDEEKDFFGGEFWGFILSGDFYITDPYYENDNPFITLSTAIKDETGNRTGTLCATLQLDKFQELIETGSHFLDNKCYMLNRGGYYLSSVNLNDVSEKTSIYNNPGNEVKLLYKTFADKAGDIGMVTVDGTRYYASTSYIPGVDWVVMEMTSVSAVYDTYSGAMAMQHFLAFSLALVSACVVRILVRWKKSRKRINTDSLCDCGSHAACIAMEMVINPRKKHSHTVLYCDLNNFKYVNDTYGHNKGDTLLQVFAGAAKRAYGNYGFVGRVGGDEFVIFMEDVSLDFVKERWELLEKDLHKISLALDFEYEITSSHGIAERRAGENTNLRNTIRLAEQRMYEEKQSAGIAR